MSIVHRRVFFGKVGTAEQLVQHLQEGDKLLQQHGASFKTRIMTDHLSGRSDRVAAEWEGDDLGEMEAAINQIMTNPQAQAVFGAWMEKLNSLIHYSEAESWHVH